MHTFMCYTGVKTHKAPAQNFHSCLSLVENCFRGIAPSPKPSLEEERGNGSQQVCCFVPFLGTHCFTCRLLHTVSFKPHIIHVVTKRKDPLLFSKNENSIHYKTSLFHHCHPSPSFSPGAKPFIQSCIVSSSSVNHYGNMSSRTLLQKMTAL